MASRESSNADGWDIPDPQETLELDSDAFKAAFGESLADTLNLDTWFPGEDLVAMYQRLQKEIAEVVEKEAGLRERIRTQVFPLAFTKQNAPINAGCYRVDPATL